MIFLASFTMHAVSSRTSLIPHLLLLLPLLFPFVSSQPSGVVNIGSSILAGDASSSPWHSPSEDFAFGFRKLDSGDDLFLLAIWFFKTQENTVVWYVKQNNNPILASKGSKIELTASNGIVLQDPHGGELWSSKLYHSGNVPVAFAVMNDTGNFQLKDSNKNPIWESFRFPSDTLLPSQVMLINDILSSRRSNESYAKGRFQFRLLEDGNAVLNTINLPTNFPYDAYYISNSRDPNNDLFNSGYNVVFDERDGYLYVLKRSGERVNLTRPPLRAEGYSTKTHYYKATLNFDGVLTVSFLPKNPSGTAGGSWKDVAVIPNNICLAARGVLGTGACGYNSICKLNPDRRPSCKCPPGYSLIDSKDEYGSCKPDIVQSCEEEVAENSTSTINELYSLVELRNTDWPMLDYELYSPFNVEDCKKVCLEDCFCVVSVFRDNNCWKKKLPLSNGREDPNERSVSFLKLRKK